MSHPEFQSWLDRFFASYYRHRPVNATFIGEHSYDDRLPDYSEQGVDSALNDATHLLREAQAIDAVTLSPIERIDKRAAEGFLRIQQWEYQSNHFQRGNPSLYLGEAILGVIGLFLTDYAPTAERVEAAIERMQGVSALLVQGEKNVRSAPIAWTRRALNECEGGTAFFGQGIDWLTAHLPVERSDFRRAADAALAAIRNYRRYLEGELLAQPNSAYACGQEAFERLMRDGHALDLSGDEIIEYADTRLDAAIAQLEEHAADFGVTDWRDALGQLADIHPPIDGYLYRYQELWDASRALAEERDLLSWPDFPLAYIPRPEWTRAAAPHLYFLFYRAPAAFNRPPIHRYLVTPIERSMPPGEVDRLLRANNDSVIKLNHVVHHGGIGHHVQNWNAYHGPSRIGQVAAVDCASRIAMFCGGTMAEGWACYATRLMDEQGFLTPLESFGEVHGDVRMSARAIVDVKLHRGEFTLEDAAQFYATRTAMSPEAAHGEAVKNSMFPGAAMMYLFGRDAIVDLRTKLQRSMGSRFNLKSFHDRFLSYGSVPVSLIADAMAKETPDAQ